MARNCIVVNIDRCSGCYGCQIACKMQHEVALGLAWNKVRIVGPVGDYPNLVRYPLPLMCQNCENAPCLEVCPTGATYRDEESGAILVDAEQCIGCQACVNACPYGQRCYNEATSTVEKCDLCHELTAKGELPACVKSCASGARFYGDLDDPDSDVSRELAKYSDDQIHTLPDSGNAPMTKYIITSMHGQDAWQELEF